METVVLPNSLAVVPTKLFKNNTQIKMVTLGEDTQIIEAEAFANSSLEKIELSKSLALIREKAFYQCPIRSIELPQILMEINDSAFQGTQLEEVTIPQITMIVGENAFADCTNLKTVMVLSQFCEFEDSSFRNCSEELTFYGVAGSTTESYAKEHGYGFVPIKEISQNEKKKNGIS